MRAQKRKTLLAALLLLAASALALAALLRLSQPNASQTELALTCTEDCQNGWRFFTEHGEVEPVFGFGGYLNGVAAEGIGPVVAERVIAAEEVRDFLQFLYDNAGIEVYLDGKLLYTDFPNAVRGVEGYLVAVDPAGIGCDGLRIPLPEDCAGKTLRVVAYTDSYDGLRWPVLPTLVSRYSDAAMQISSTVWPMAAITTLLLLALALLLVFLFSAQTGQLQWKLLPLALYFLLAVLPLVRNSYLATGAGLDTSVTLLFFSRLSIDALFCFLALELAGWRRWALLGGAAGHALLTALLAFSGLALPLNIDADTVGFVLFLLSLLLLLRAKRPQLRRSALAVCAAAGLLLALYGVSRLLDTDTLYLLTNPVSALLLGHDSRAFFTVLRGLTALLCAVQTVAGFIRGFLLRQRQAQAMQARSQLVQTNYEQTLETLSQTAAFRHEWKNHVAVLDVLLRKQDLAGAAAYLAQLDGQLDQLSAHSYTANFTVNTILQRFAALSEQQGVHFVASASLPETLGLDESDLCRFLFNLLDNALEGARTAPKKAAREIHCSLQIRQQYLAICCENTYSGVVSTDERGQLQTTKGAPGEHGFGLMQMRTIAEKYGSTLSISYDTQRFTVMSVLKLHA